MGADDAQKLPDLVPFLNINDISLFSFDHFGVKVKPIHQAADGRGVVLVSGDDLQMIGAAVGLFTEPLAMNAPRR